MDKLSSLSIFFPAFNEEKNIPIVLSQVLELGLKIADKYEVIVVDDGSMDQTAEVVRDFIKKHSNIKLIQHKENLGYGSALKTGFYNSKFDYITYMDGDGQFDFSEIVKLILKMEEEKSDIAIGFRIKRQDRFVRVINGKLWNFLCSSLMGLRIRDIDCGFKLVKRKVIDDIPKLESSGATISAELLVKAKKKGFKISQVGLIHKDRLFGKATGGNPLHIFRAFYDLFTILPKV